VFGIGVSFGYHQSQADRRAIMNIALAIGDWLVILAFLGLVIASGMVLFAAFQLKDGVVRNAKRIYERPLRSVNNLVAASKGVVQQEAVRAAGAGKNVQSAAAAVKATVADIKIAADGLQGIDWQGTTSAALGAIKFAAIAADVARAAAKQGQR
jgi:hypothetical protein